MTQAGYYSIELSLDSRLRASCNTSLVVKCPVPLSPMPVKLIDFSGQRLDVGHIQLNWITSAEINNDRFSIERSSNPAVGFEVIGLVQGKGTTDQNVAYRFIDSSTSAGYTYTYYRLKQIDYDGTYSYSQIIAIQGIRSALSVVVFPNPSEAHQLTFRLSGVSASDELSVVVYDAQGRLLYQQQNAVLDASQQVRMPVSVCVPAGRYYVQVRAKNQQVTSPFLVRP